MITNTGQCCQATYATGAGSPRKATRALRKAGYRVSVSSLGPQRTSHGVIRMSIIDVRPGINDDVFDASDLLRGLFPACDD